MANLNKVMLIGRLTRDPEIRTFANGGKVAKFGFAVNNRKKNTQTQEWEDEPVFIDVDAFNRGDFGKLADQVEQNLRKGRQIYLEGHLKFEQWTSQDGQKRSKLAVVMDSFQYLDSKPEGMGGESNQRNESRPASASAPQNGSYDEPEHEFVPPPTKGTEGDIPF